MIKKLLILQPWFVKIVATDTQIERSQYIHKHMKSLPYGKSALVQKILGKLFVPPYINITSEFCHYGELPHIMGVENVYAIDQYHPCYYEEKPSSSKFLKAENYPSCFGYPKPQFLSFDTALESIKAFDAVLASVYCGGKARRIMKKAKDSGVLVALFDNIDHERVYLEPPQSFIFRGFDEKLFDIFFKKDIPIGHQDKRLIPIAPVPCKNSSPLSDVKDWEARKNSVFFVGSYRKGLTRMDRLDVCNLVNNKIDKAKMLINQSAISGTEYEQEVLDSKILLSPSGRVWCSFRHADFAHYKMPVVMPEPNCETAGPKFIDGKNCLTYESKLVDGEFRLVNADQLIDKINYVLSNETYAKQIGQEYYQTIQNGHTTHHRAQYIYDQLSYFKTKGIN